VLGSAFKPMVCRHEWSWSERRQVDRCHKCGKLKPETQPAETPAPAVERAHIATAQPPLSREDRLRGHLDALAAGRALTRVQTLETVLALIEDMQSSDPLLSGPTAATYYAMLHEELKGPRALAS